MPILTTIGAASARNYGLFGKTGLIVDYTVVAGGNSGPGFISGFGSTGGPGGAAGQLLYVSGRSVNIGSYSVVVGGGGAKNVNQYGVAGSTSSFNGTTAAVGTAGDGVQTSGAGYTRGNTVTNDFYETSASGGGGGNSSNGYVGSVPREAYGGNGGSGSSDVILGVTRAGGGGGSASTPGTNIGGAGGSGAAGGGGGALTQGGTNNPGGDASANYGSGGGAGAGTNSGGYGGNGGSGIVIIRYSDIGGQRASGGTVTQSGGYYIHTFTGSGTFTVNY
jgi:hypothetical protein